MARNMNNALHLNGSPSCDSECCGSLLLFVLEIPSNTFAAGPNLVPDYFRAIYGSAQNLTPPFLKQRSKIFGRVWLSHAQSRLWLSVYQEPCMALVPVEPRYYSLPIHSNAKVDAFLLGHTLMQTLNHCLSEVLLMMYASLCHLVTNSGL